MGVVGYIVVHNIHLGTVYHHNNSFHQAYCVCFWLFFFALFDYGSLMFQMNISYYHQSDWLILR